MCEKDRELSSDFATKFSTELSDSEVWHFSFCFKKRRCLQILETGLGPT